MSGGGGDGGCLAGPTRLQDLATCDQFLLFSCNCFVIDLLLSPMLGVFVVFPFLSIFISGQEGDRRGGGWRMDKTNQA